MSYRIKKEDSLECGECGLIRLPKPLDSSKVHEELEGVLLAKSKNERDQKEDLQNLLRVVELR